jgi:hypothetical protein
MRNIIDYRRRSNGLTAADTVMQGASSRPPQLTVTSENRTTSVLEDVSGSTPPIHRRSGDALKNPAPRRGRPPKSQTITAPKPKLPAPGSVVLQQLQYRSYKYTILLYHYSAYLLPQWKLRNTMTLYEKGYHHSSLGLDPLRNMRVAPGDEIPPGRIEVAYLPHVFQKGGSAVGFRTPGRNIEWLCFRLPAQGLLEQARGDNGEVLFDLVATLEKGGKGEKGHPEHRAWFESVRDSTEKDITLHLSWKNKQRDWELHEKEREAQEKEAQEREMKEREAQETGNGACTFGMWIPGSDPTIDVDAPLTLELVGRPTEDPPASPSTESSSTTTSSTSTPSTTRSPTLADDEYVDE